ncbi:hypothetical protein IEQ34_023138 [Dendrobium chrysotoxum]|uniref:Uncharacterized protein n=1 Tax=Dendrobium chrysotoxum TaxID=161865 RepID=A0AAV7G0V4_DENCH|nr:hypothetical protein IEQ34_023138 [Dendrobium chrysotoxum]
MKRLSRDRSSPEASAGSVAFEGEGEFSCDYRSRCSTMNLESCCSALPNSLFCCPEGSRLQSRYSSRFHVLFRQPEDLLVAVHRRSKAVQLLGRIPTRCPRIPDQEPLNSDTLAPPDPNLIKDILLGKVYRDDIKLISNKSDLTLNPLELNLEDSDLIDLESINLRVVTKLDPTEIINMNSKDINLNLNNSELNLKVEHPRVLLKSILGVAPLDLHLKECVFLDWTYFTIPRTNFTVRECISPYSYVISLTVVPTSVMDTLPHLLSPIPAGDSLGYPIMVVSQNPSSYHIPDSSIMPSILLSSYNLESCCSALPNSLFCCPEGSHLQSRDSSMFHVLLRQPEDLLVAVHRRSKAVQPLGRIPTRCPRIPDQDLTTWSIVDLESITSRILSSTLESPHRYCQRQYAIDLKFSVQTVVRVMLVITLLEAHNNFGVQCRLVRITHFVADVSLLLSFMEKDVIEADKSEA